ncbi:MAG: glycosyltransferase family 1 protein [Candidatus Hydrogenedentales bacterium]
MRVLINGLQAGNRSGTGVYTTQLAAKLVALAEMGTIEVFWPADIPLPDGTAGRESAFHLTARMSQARRIWFDQMGIQAQAMKGKFDLIHYPANFGALLRRMPSVLTVHDLTFLRDPSWYKAERATYYRIAIRRSVRNARRIIAVSQATANDLTNMLGVPAERIDVVHNGVDPRFKPIGEQGRREVSAKYALADPYVLFVGTIEPRKNLPRLVEAWSSVAGNAGPSLVIAGRQGWKTEAVRESVARSPHGKRVRFLGHVPPEDLPALMSGAAVFAYPSLYEGFGIPVAEAMACGTPVLTSNVSSLPEVAGDAAVLVDPEDTIAIASGLERLLSSESLRSDLRGRGLRRANQLSWDKAARQTLETYRKALAGK